jgi:iron complex transport system permease protein
VLATLALLALAAFAYALLAGSIEISAGAVARALLARDQDPSGAIVRELRLPRAIAAFAVGAMLALAGTMMQVLLRNPLADPYVLGLSGGAACGALAALLAGAAVLMTPAAFAGALLSTFLVFGLARGRGAWVRGMVYWLIGDLSGATRGGTALTALLGVLVAGMFFARDATMLARGDLTAASLGVSVRSTTIALHVLAAFATAVAVTVAGSVGFVGLVVPHAVRLVVGNDQRWLMPAAALAGGSLLTFADTIARTLVAPAQLPVGVLTALVGVPLFLWLLRRSER